MMPRLKHFAATLLAMSVALVRLAIADGAPFTATVDRELVGQDESVSLKLSVQADGRARVGEPEFEAPDFDVLNQYRSTFVESFYENGHFGMRNNQSVTVILRPKKTGSLKISSIRVNVNGQSLTASPITVNVTAGGAGSPPPRGYTSGLGMRGSGQRLKGRDFFLKADVSKSRVYKGEMVVVSYSLYRRTRVFNLQIDKYPTMNGFLREELEMPVLGQRLESQSVVVEGVPYERSLLVKYAAFPLKDGKLQLDSMGARLSYFGARQGRQADDDEDPVMNFFQQFQGLGQTLTGTMQSEPVVIEVLPLPTDGKPDRYSGAVGSFSISSAADRNDVKAGEAVTVTVKIEGRGSLASVENLDIAWPADVQLFDSKAKNKNAKAAIAEKVFEYIVIPKQAGSLTLPAVEFSYFDPDQKSYSTVRTQPIPVTVHPGDGQAASEPQQTSRSAGTPAAGASQAAKTVETFATPEFQSIIAKAVRALAALIALLAVIWLLMKTKARLKLRSIERKKNSLDWKAVDSAVKLAQKTSQAADLVKAYDELANLVHEAIDKKTKLLSRSHPRSELRQLLTETQQFKPEWVDRLMKLLEFAETYRFAGSAGVISENDARGELQKWVEEARSLVDTLPN